MNLKTFSKYINQYKLITFATNKNGNKIFCRLTYKKKTVAKGMYDFDKEKFFVIQYLLQNFPQGVKKYTINNILHFYLKLDYDWNL